MKKIKKVKLKRPYINKQYRFMFEGDYVPQKYNIIYGGTGSSKSFSLIEMLVGNCIKYSTFDILVVRKFATTLKDTVEMPWLDMLTKRYQNILSGHGLVEGRDFSYNRTLKQIKFASGSIVRFKGYDNPEKLKGIDNVNVLWCEECTDFTQSDLEDIQDRLRATPPKNHPWGRELKIFCTFNPIFKSHWIRTYFFKDSIDMTEEIHKDIVLDNKTTFALKTTWRDNKFYNGQYQDENLRRKMRATNPRKFGVQCNGNWGVLGELIYENYTVKELIKNHSHYDNVSYGLDFGFGHSTAFHEVAMKDGDIYVLREMYKPKLTATDICKILKKMYPYTKEEYGIFLKEAKEKFNDKEEIDIYIYNNFKEKYYYTNVIKELESDIKEGKYKISSLNLTALAEEIQEEIGISYNNLKIYCDNARPEAIEEMQRYGFRGAMSCTKGANSVWEGIEWLQDRHIYIDISCTGAINEIESYQWQKDKTTGDRINKPVKTNDDAMDSIRYATEKFKTRKGIRVSRF